MIPSPAQLRLLLCVLPLLLFNRTGEAKSVVCPSFELKIARANYVGIYETGDVRSPLSSTRDIRCLLRRSMHGECPDTLVLADYVTTPAPKPGDELLVLGPTKGSEVINLTRPETRGSMHSAITTDFIVLSDRTTILNTVGKRLARIKADPDAALRSRVGLKTVVPLNSEAHALLYSMSGVCLKFPSDPEYLDALLEMVQKESGGKRANTLILIINAYPHASIREYLLSMLADEGTVRRKAWYSDDTLTYFPARQLAYQVLTTRLGEELDPPPGYQAGSDLLHPIYPMLTRFIVLSDPKHPYTCQGHW